ncbi:MAG: DUF1858 domain-containing protein [Anaerolineales bacterium]|nr:DUF1858 domain-containing protein [Anaerolineales bacterium]
MERSTNAILDHTWTVAQVLSTYPQVAQVFFHLKADCVGCVLSRFCTLEEVARAYDLEQNHLVELICQTVNLSLSKE